MTSPLCLEIVKDSFIAISLFIAGYRNQKELEFTHVLVLELIDLLRKKRIARANEEDREPFHSALLDRLADVSPNFDQLQFDLFRVELDVELSADVLGKLFLGQTYGHRSISFAGIMVAFGPEYIIRRPLEYSEG